MALRSKKGKERDLPICKDGQSFYHMKRKIIKLLTDFVEDKLNIGCSSFNRLCGHSFLNMSILLFPDC